MQDDSHPTPPFHAGELAAQKRFNVAWDDRQAAKLGRIVGSTVDREMARFIERLPFFFLATADSRGHCDCSFKGTEPGVDGGLLPAVWVTGPRRLLFPDYAGNRMFNSLGNILDNPHVGLLFIDFAAQKRLRVNGSAGILDEVGEWRSKWPDAARAVEVDIDQVYWNCPRRIPKHP